MYEIENQYKEEVRRYTIIIMCTYTPSPKTEKGSDRETPLLFSDETRLNSSKQLHRSISIDDDREREREKEREAHIVRNVYSIRVSPHPHT